MSTTSTTPEARMYIQPHFSQFTPPCLRGWRGWRGRSTLTCCAMSLMIRSIPLR